MQGAEAIINDIKTGKISSSYSHSNGFPNVNCYGLINQLLIRAKLTTPLQEVQDFVDSQNSIQKSKFFDPSPSHYVLFFSAIGPMQFWSRVYYAKDLKAGDIIAYTSDINMGVFSERGQHIMIVASEVTIDPKSSHAVVPIFDSTKIPHGKGDLRKNGNGIGQGTIELELNSEGSPTKIKWSEQSKHKLTRNIKMARVLE